MRYFKYGSAIPDLETIQRNGKLLFTAAQRQHRRANLLGKLGTAVFCVLFVILSAGLLFLINRIMPDEEGVFLAIVDFFGTIVLSGFALILAAIVAAVAATPLWAKRQNTEKLLLREALSNACNELKSFYQFQEPFIVTKCYCSSNRRFDRHDVCIFIADQELRITANLNYGFFDPKRDLGCYCLTRQEIQLIDTQHKDRVAVELHTEDVTFVLGRKSRTFIEKEYLRISS